MYYRILALLLLASQHSNCFAQTPTKFLYEKTIKIAAADSLLELPASVKNQLRNAFPARKKASSISLLLTGTDKNLINKTGNWIAATLQKDIYKIDLSILTSQYIGETEKNLERVFNNAAGSGAVLFFDEADALFGKRTGVRDAHDKYANQEISYFYNRLASYKGTVLISCLNDCIPDYEQKKIIKVVVR
jgi:SpoVK/Ycf46/Vps4 family AAA+-type ATPase